MESANKPNGIHETIGKVEAVSHDAVNKAANVANQAADELRKKGQQIKNAEQQMLEKCRGYVHEKPISSLGIALGVGFILSRLLSGR